MQTRSAATSQGGPGGGSPPVTNTGYKVGQTRSAATSQGGPGGGSPPVNSGGVRGGRKPPPMCPQDPRGNFGFGGHSVSQHKKETPN